MDLYTIKNILCNIRIIKSIYYNIISKGNRGLRNKILFYGNVRISLRRGSKINILNGFLHFNRGTMTNEPFYSMLEMQRNSTLNIKNSFIVKSGAHIIITEGATLSLGGGYINRNVKIRCFDRIEIGNNVAISENVTIWDSDAHEIIANGTKKTKPVFIGNKVWIGTNVIILKGVTIGDGSVIAAGSLVNKSIPPNCLAGGVPAKVISSNIMWKN